MINERQYELLEFGRVKELVKAGCYGRGARAFCDLIMPSSVQADILPELHRTSEMRIALSGDHYFPNVDHEEVPDEIRLLQLEASLLNETQLLAIARLAEVSDTVSRFLKGKRTEFPYLSASAENVPSFGQLVKSIDQVIDPEGQVRSSASPELLHIRKQIADNRRESDKRFYNHVAQLRKLGYLRGNEESFFNGRRTLAVLAEYKSEVSGVVHGKSESGRTVFIEPGSVVSVNNEVAELEIDERREINRILRELCRQIRPFASGLRQAQDLLTYLDFVRAKARFARSINAVLPRITGIGRLRLLEGVHPLLLLHNKAVGKATVPVSFDLSEKQRILVISGPNAGGKTVALKTAGLLQIMFQSGLLVSADENSEFGFFEKVLIDIGDTQSIDNELSTYSAKLKSMTGILAAADENSLVLMDEFGTGTDPELGSAIAETVLEKLIETRARGIITSHFGNVKLLADKLEGATNASMLFDLAQLEPLFVLNVGQPGSSYTFEVAERTGFPKDLIERAKKKVDQEKLRLNQLLAEVQDQKTKLLQERERAEHETFLGRMAKEKYKTLFDTWEKKILSEREKRIELNRLAEYGQKYLRLMDDWNERKDRKLVIKRFIDGITAETKKQELLRKQTKLDDYAEKKIARLKPNLHVGSRVRVLNGSEVGVVEDIKDEKVLIRFGALKMTVGMQNLLLAE